MVAGSRSLVVDPSALADALAWVCPDGCCVVSGGARGVDAAAPAAARLLGWRSVVYRPDYARFGRRAPLVRNDAMLAVAQLVVVVWDGVSPGTAYVVRRARALGLPLLVLPPG